HGAALEVLAVLGVLGLVVDHHLDRLVALVRRDNSLNRPKERTLGFVLCGLFGCCCHFYSRNPRCCAPPLIICSHCSRTSSRFPVHADAGSSASARCP